MDQAGDWRWLAFIESTFIGVGVVVGTDQVVVMNQGEVVEQGLKTDVFQPPHPDYTNLLLSSVPEMDPDWLTNLSRQRAEAAS